MSACTTLDGTAYYSRFPLVSPMSLPWTWSILYLHLHQTVTTYLWSVVTGSPAGRYLEQSCNQAVVMVIRNVLSSLYPNTWVKQITCLNWVLMLSLILASIPHLLFHVWNKRHWYNCCRRESCYEARNLSVNTAVRYWSVNMGEDNPWSNKSLLSSIAYRFGSKQLDFCF